ncbi:MAG: hypothetical protein CVU97_05440 [Firmicutes bacterium HGW-Firmicutes-21]|nr:MAG: hypothetical protein CVU97_05440 [Firmicutes bacterium HGW-Firmicutes-21]
MRNKVVSFILFLSLTTGLLSSCSKLSQEKNELDLEVTLGGSIFKAKTLNKDITDESIAVYTRDYTDKNGVILLKLTGAHSNRAVYSVRYSKDETGASFTILSADSSSGDKSNTPIPVNGFVISLPLSLVDGLRIKVNQDITVKGFEDLAPEYERFDLGTFIPENKLYTRRVSYINPYMGVSEQPCITLITNDYGKEVQLPSGSVAFIMRLVASDNYRINSILSEGTVPVGSNALIFTGEYNALYAKTFFTEEDKLYISRKDRISSYSDESAVLIGKDLYKVGEQKTNLEAINESGVYIFNSFFNSIVTPARELDFYDIVIVDDTVVYKGEKNTRIMLPSNSGVVVSFVGDKISLAENLSLGDNVSAILVQTRNLPERYLQTGGYIFEITSIDDARSNQNTCVLYTPDFGRTTGTGTDGTEIIISEGKIKAVEIAKGNTEIPADGYVLSIQRSNSSYKYADSLQAGSGYVLSLAGRVYSMSRLNIDSINSVRSTDMLILYKGGQSTGTNPYGYEIVVSSDGRISGESYTGNSKIPAEGFALSGHGEAEKALKAVYTFGANVIIDEISKTATILKTPILTIENAALAYKNAKDSFNAAKAAFYDINYNTVGKSLDDIEKTIDHIGRAMDEYDYSTAIHLSVIASEKLDKLSYSMIRSSAVENRAVWYRSNDKSESDVINAIQKAAALNINTIYLETWYNGKVIGYSDNSLIRHNAKANGDLDALEAFCRIGREYGIEIHAWVENFFIGTLQEADMDPDSLVNKTYGKHLLDSQGNNYNRTTYGDFVFLNPYDRNNRALVFEVYKEIITKYDISGIHLDYIRFPEFNYQLYDYGYNEDIIKGFQRAYNTSIDPKTLTPGTAMHDNWCKFRENIINSWVEDVFDLVMDTKPELWISCAAYPEANAVPKTIFQNVRYWVEKGWMDEVFSMSYSTDNDFVRENAALFKSITTDKAFYAAGLSVFGTTTEINLAKQIDLIRDVGAEGSALFSLASISDKNYGNAIISGPYSVKSVQTYLLSKTISAGMDDILRKLNDVYGIDGKHKYDAHILPLISAMKAEADAFDLDNATISQKAAYVQKAISDLNNIVSVINGIAASGDERNMKNALLSDFNTLIKYMNQSQNRLNARLS